MIRKESKQLFYDEDEYSTHQPFLWHYLKKTTKPILELGAGFGSTPLLNLYCKTHSIPLYTLDHDWAWLGRFKEMNSQLHQLIYVDVEEFGWEHYLESIPKNDWGLVFIDQGSWQSRVDTARFLKDKSDYIIIHDFDALCESYNFGKNVKPIDTDTEEEGIYDLSSEFTYSRMVWPKKPWPGKTGPPTLIASMKYKELTLPEDGEIDIDVRNLLKDY